ncbi:MAG: hypothetical protein ACRDU8_06845 [Egibacteraceae bacterium]
MRLWEYDEHDEYAGDGRWMWVAGPLPRLPAPQLHTPEGEEACLVEGRFGVVDLDAVGARFDQVYQRSGEGWVEALDVAEDRWVRVALWTAAPDRVLVEASSQEAYARAEQVLASLQPPARHRADQTYEFGEYPHGYNLHRGKLRERRPGDGPWEALQRLVEREERRWLDAPTLLLDGRSPREAAANPDAVYAVHELLGWAERGSINEVGMLATFDVDRVRQALGLGRRRRPPVPYW